MIQELRDLGIVVSIDDFGAGFTSLAHLSQPGGEGAETRPGLHQPAHRRATARRDLNLVRATIELGHAMGLRIVAEGIEDLATLQLLSELGCDLGQGYFIGKPKPADLLAFRAQPAAPADQIPHQLTKPPAQHAPQLDQRLAVARLGSAVGFGGDVLEQAGWMRVRTPLAHGSSSSSMSRAATLLSSMPNARNDFTVTGSSPAVSATVSHIRPRRARTSSRTSLSPQAANPCSCNKSVVRSASIS